LDPALVDNETLQDDVADLTNDTDLEGRAVRDGVVQLTCAVATRDDLAEVIAEIMGLDDVLEVDTADVDIR